MRASWRWPRTVVFVRELLGQVPGPSKRTSFRASVFETYTFPVTGLVTMLKRIVPTPGVRHPRLGRRAPRGIDHEHVLVKQREADGVVPVAAELVLPRVVWVELDDHARLGLRIAEAVDV